MTIHVVGAGMAGLAAAVRLAAAGAPVAVHEAAPQAGGRCRSYRDKTLERVIDNGNHLMLSGNHDLLGFLQLVGARDRLTGPDEARYPFLDLITGERWDIRIGAGRLFSRFADPTRSVPGARLTDRLRGWRLALAGKGATVADCLGSTGRLWDRFWEPMATAVLNTPPDLASARLLKAAMMESFARGGDACRPLIARESLAASLIDPALTFLTRQGADFAFGRRLRKIEMTGRAEGLHFVGLDLSLEPADQVILALPPSQTADLVPGLQTPRGTHAIVNAHFLLSEQTSLPGKSMLLGLVGGEAEWLFLRDDVASVTVSAADRLADEPAEVIATRLWKDVSAALDLPPNPVPAHRVIKEKRATFSQTSAEIAKRPPCKTRWPNLHLAGDWTDTNLPATIEGAVRSGHRAADAVLAVSGGKVKP